MTVLQSVLLCKGVHCYKASSLWQVVADSCKNCTKHYDTHRLKLITSGSLTAATT